MDKGNTIVEEIIEIEKEIKEIRTNTTYLKLKENLRLLENPPHFNRTFTISSPHNLSRTIEVYRRSKDIDPLKEEFESRIRRYEKRLDSLYTKKRKLKKRLFG